MLETLSWIDTSEARFLFVSRTLIFGFATVAVLSAFWPRLDARFTDRRATLGYLAAALLVLVGTRWPTFFIRGPLNQDEAQMLAQAITALHNPIPWLSFDGTTSGPFNTYVLTLPALVFLHPSFFTTRVIGLLLEFGAIVSLYVAAALRFDRTIARIAIVPPALLFAGLTDPELVHYSSERLSIFLGTLSLALLCLALRHRLGAGWLFGIGLATGTMPLAKLQATPLAAALAALSLVVVLTSPA